MISRRSGSSGSRNKSFPGSQPQSSPTWCPLEIQWKDERGETASHITPNQHLPKYVSLLDKGALPPKDLKNSILFRCSLRSRLRNNNPKEESSIKNCISQDLIEMVVALQGQVDQQGRKVKSQSSCYISCRCRCLCQNLLFMAHCKWCHENSQFFLCPDWRLGRLYWQHVDKNSRGDTNIAYVQKTPNMNMY